MRAVELMQYLLEDIKNAMFSLLDTITSQKGYEICASVFEDIENMENILKEVSCGGSLED